MIIGTFFAGKVLECENTTVRTKFFMLSFIPIVPIGSFYVLNDSEHNSTTIPFVGSSESILALEMRGVNSTSSLAGYARWISFALALVGFLWIRIDNFGTPFSEEYTFLSYVCFIVFLGLGILSMTIGRKDDEMVYEVRSIYSKLIGMAVDPTQLSDGAWKKIKRSVIGIQRDIRAMVKENPNCMSDEFKIQYDIFIKRYNGEDITDDFRKLKGLVSN